MNELIVLVGLPASGKSTISEEYRKLGYTIHSSDVIREELSITEHTGDFNALVFNTMNSRTKESLNNGENVVYDATNISKKKRTATLMEFKRSCTEFHAKAVVVMLDVHECKVRDVQRDRTVGEEVIERMYRSWQCPYYFEGWDEIEVRYTGEEIKWDDYRQSKMDFALKLLKESQDNPNHTRTIGAHCHEAGRLSLQKRYPIKVSIACVAHDHGKLHTKSFRDAKGTITEVAHYYGHESVGAYLFLLDREKWQGLGKDVDDMYLYITNLIQYHMLPHNFTGDKLHDNKHKKLFGDEMWTHLLQINECDREAK